MWTPEGENCMKRKKYRNKAAVFGLAVAAGFCFTQTVRAEGTKEPAGPATTVWLDVVKKPKQDRICVTVPMAYGFVVVGSQDTEDMTPITVENGTLLLPDVRVEKKTGENGQEEYSLSLTSPKELLTRNYSTTVLEENEDTGIRTGLGVKLGAYMEEEDDRGNWTLTEETPEPSAEDFKKYQMVLDDKAFSKKESGSGFEKDRFYMDGEISLDAPPDLEKHGWTAAGTANVPSEYRVNVDVRVGGVKGNYNQTEESAKVGMIHWTVMPDQDENQ